MVDRTSKYFGFFVSILILLVPYSAQSQGVNPNTPDQIRRAYDKAFETMFQDPGSLEKTFSFAGLAIKTCLLYTSPSPRDRTRSRMPSSA